MRTFEITILFETASDDTMENIVNKISHTLSKGIDTEIKFAGSSCGEITNKNLGERSEPPHPLLGDVLSLLKIQEDYINFLSEYANKYSEYLRIHGIVPTKKEIDKGQDFRDNIEIYAKKVFEDGKLIEKMKI